jgi:hypothetical protein
MVGKAKEQVEAQEGCACLEEVHWSEADECSYAEEIVGDDEGKVGGEEEGCLAWLCRYLHWLCVHRPRHGQMASLQRSSLPIRAARTQRIPYHRPSVPRIKTLQRRCRKPIKIAVTLAAFAGPGVTLPGALSAWNPPVGPDAIRAYHNGEGDSQKGTRVVNTQLGWNEA